jgi:serine/threonine-protein kinase RsbT
MTKKVGLPEADQAKVQIAVSELANNILQHARGKGSITIDAVTERGRVGIIVIAEDMGPGIADIDLALHEPNSATGLGIGLGAVERLMSEFKIEPVNAHGIRVTAVKWKN